MKKILTAAFVASSFMVSQASADFMRVEMGAGAWDYKPSGTASYTDYSGTGTYKSDEKKSSDAYVWMLIKHPIPIVPNLRLEYCDVKDEGLVSGKFKDFEVPSGVTHVNARFELKQYDIIPYYNLLDNLMWTTVDIGLDIKVIDSTFEADNVYVLGATIPSQYNDSDLIAIPLAYARARVEVPGTGLGLEADGKYVTYDGSTVYDFRAKVDYTFDFDVIQPGLEIGYRVQKFDIKTDDDKTKMNVDFSGFYAGLMLRF